MEASSVVFSGHLWKLLLGPWKKQLSGGPVLVKLGFCPVFSGKVGNSLVGRILGTYYSLYALLIRFSISF